MFSLFERRAVPAMFPFVIYTNCIECVSNTHPGRMLEIAIEEVGAATAVTCEFAISDCLRMCAKLMPLRFSGVSTSIVAGHVGLLPLLQAAQIQVFFLISWYLVTNACRALP